MAASHYLQWLSRSLSSERSEPSPTSNPVDTVLGYAVGYGVAEIAPFIRSLRSVFSGQVILVVDRKPTLLAWLATHGVRTEIAADWSLRWKPHPVVARFAAYAHILQQRPDIGRVVTTDVRDVVFQGDPFERAADDLEFFVEAEERTLADHAFNLKHLQALAGDGVARAISQSACVCVGVVAGPAAAVARFCRAILLLCAIPRSNIGGAFGTDQAACNVIAHLNLVGGDIRPNFGRVATIGLTPPDQLRWEHGQIVNPDASISPIVHQYDRIGFLADHIQDRWGLPPDNARRKRKKTLLQRARTIRSSVLRRLPELR
jgi:hypothetical protein